MTFARGYRFSSQYQLRNGKTGQTGMSVHKKMGLLLGNKSPGRRVPFAGVVFTPTRGVIHPSFPLRGRWERISKSAEQAPSPSLVASLHSFYETRQRRGMMHGERQILAVLLT